MMNVDEELICSFQVSFSSLFLKKNLFDDLLPLCVLFIYIDLETCGEKTEIRRGNLAISTTTARVRPRLRPEGEQVSQLAAA